MRSNIPPIHAPVCLPSRAPAHPHAGALVGKRLCAWAFSLLWLSSLSACTSPETEPPLRLVGLYDMTAISAMEEVKDPLFHWRSDPRVLASCGPERAPAGLERPEAELMALQQMPTLAVLVEHRLDHPDAESLRTPIQASQLRLFVDTGKGEAGDPKRYAFLQPAVLPLRLDITPSLKTAAPLLGQTIFFQTTVELCAEHKLGRAWTGTAEEQLLDEAFLRKVDISPTEAFFRGQGRPVAPQLGPPVWSLDLYDPNLPRWIQEVWGEWPGEQIDGATLVEADIWGARAPRPARSADQAFGVELPGARALHTMPFLAGEGELCAVTGLAAQANTPSACLTQSGPPLLKLKLELSATGTEGPAPEEAAQSGATRLLAELTGLPSGSPEVLLDRVLSDDARAEDVVARVPRYLPRFESPLNPKRAYTLLLVPDWQLAQVLGKSEVQEGQEPRSSVHDATGYILAHPELLHLQYVPERVALVQDLMSPLRGEWSSLPGYSPGLWAAGAPVLIPHGAEGQQVTAAQHQAAHRADWIPLQGGGLLLVLALLSLGFNRLGELWQRPPVERAAFWPGETWNRGIERDPTEGLKTGSRRGGADHAPDE